MIHIQGHWTTREDQIAINFNQKQFWQTSGGGGRREAPEKGKLCTTSQTAVNLWCVLKLFIVYCYAPVLGDSLIISLEYIVKNFYESLKIRMPWQNSHSGLSGRSADLK